MQLVLDYTPLQTAFALVPLALPVVLLGSTTHLWLPRIGLRTAVAGGLLLIAVGLLCMRVLEIDSPYLDLAWPLLIVSAGIGLCTAPTTSAIMGAVPDDKQGVASAVNDTTREVGAALGIAAAGSVLAAQYEHLLAPAIAALPEQVRGPALDSLAHALAAAEQMGPTGAALAENAQRAFLSAMDMSLTVLAAGLAVAALFVAVWSPGRDGRQLRIVRGRRSAPGAHRIQEHRTP
jgi:hypothetical protein